MINKFSEIEGKIGKDRNHLGVQKILNQLNNPQDKLKIIHVAGTNGKGSTCNYLNNILIDAGNKVGLFTSPHIYQHNERIKINNTNISDDDYFAIYNDLKNQFDYYELGMFEIDFVIAVTYFQKQQCDYVILEVGIGGLLDCTNIVHPLICAITSISYDHQAILGDTIEDIAKQKAGIIKEKIPCVCFKDNIVARKVIENICKKQSAPIIIIKDCHYHNKKFEYKDILIDQLSVPNYQLNNIRIAIEVSKYLKVNKRHIINGIKNSYWPGRYEILSRNPLIILDGSHNVDAIKKLLLNVPDSINIIFSASQDKDYLKIINLLKDKSDKIILAKFNNNRCFDAQNISKQLGLEYCDNLHKLIIDILNGEENYLICGSLYLVSDVLKIINSLKK